MISILTMTGFIDEMEKISASKNGTKNFWAKKKTATFLGNVGDVIKQTGGRIAGTARGMGVNAGRTLRDMATSPLQSTAKGFSHTIKSSLSGSKKSRAFNVGMLGLQGAQIYGDTKGLVRDDGTGRGTGERLGNLVGNTAGGFIGARHGLTGGIVGGEVARRGLGAVGKGVDKVVAMGRKKPEHAPMPQGQVQE